MGYRGDDATHGAWGRQTPWQSSPDDYPPTGDGGSGYGPGNGYSGQGQPGYGQQGQGGQYEGGQYEGGQHGGDPYGQQPYQQYDDYDDYQQAPPDGTADYGGPAGYPQQDNNGYAPGPNGADPYGNRGPAPSPSPGHGGSYGQDGGYGYQNQPTDGYGNQGTSGYPNQSSGSYGQPGGYRQPGGGYGQDQPGGYGQDQARGYGQPGGYREQGTGNYPGDGSGYASGATGYQGEATGYGQPGGYPPQYQGSGGYPALPGGSGSYPTEDAGNDWYGGQPAAANGASFADTGSYRLNGSVLDEYGTGPRGALRDPVRGYPPGPGQPGSGELPTSVLPVASGPQSFQGTGPQTLRRTGQQERPDENRQYPQHGPGPGEPGIRPGRATGSFQSLGGRGSYDTQAGDTQAGDDQFGRPGGQGTDDYDGFNEATTLYTDADRGGYDDYDAGGDPYLDQYGGGTGPAPAPAAGRGGSRKAPSRGSALGNLGGRRLLYSAIAVVVVIIVGVVAAATLFSSKSPSNTASPQGALPTASTNQSEQACVKNLGSYCYISQRTDDPTPLTTAELYLPTFTNESDKASYSMVSSKVDTSCANAVIGPNLISALKSGNCTQVLRASYVSSDNKIMGTIGVVNLATTNQAHYAGKVVGATNFIAPLTSATGVANKLGKGTGVVEAEFKGHYLILTWAEFVNGTTPTTTAEDNQLERFSNDLVEGTANIYLSQRMVNGVTAGSGSSASPSASSTAK